MLRNILGPVFNLYLDQFLTYKICFFLFFVFGWNPYFIVFSAKIQNLKKHKKGKKHTICEHNCANCSCSSVLFSAFFIFAVFFQFPFFWRCFCLVSQNQKNTKKNQSKQNKKQEQKEDKRCKTKTNERLWFKTKQDNKQNNRNQRTTKSKQNKKKKQEPETEMTKNRKEGNKKEEERERDKEKGESETRQKRNKGTHRTKYTKMPFLGGKTGFFF